MEQVTLADYNKLLEENKKLSKDHNNLLNKLLIERNRTKGLEHRLTAAQTENIRIPNPMNLTQKLIHDLQAEIDKLTVRNRRLITMNKALEIHLDKATKKTMPHHYYQKDYPPTWAIIIGCILFFGCLFIMAWGPLW